MNLSDPVANMLTSIRNANMRGYKTVIFPYSVFKWQICKKLVGNNFLSQCWYDDKNRNIKVDIKYANQNSRIHQIKKISKPSQHIHWQVAELKKNCRGRGFYFISTPFGLLTHREALAKNQGGKIIFFIS
ncbi:30S ribosomal protein S8 [endosymbiont DhMRE of Dentiscutata heterogama]|uniref:uS8 family ribosomal protein n=1 Tax=endosymbiont DhMRE of Dentiscutata heterogama TaxID=1609546 RepID=UPI000629D291|nr:30S ribosomal protein S8 [endosymbiont DhMRE of Dentiscutata heterogama]CFW92884.1 30S ribosomal protein S8 [endosymbiont DhMRE of Dentiscutata heterogama]